MKECLGCKISIEDHKKYCTPKCRQNYHNSLKVGAKSCKCGEKIYADSNWCRKCRIYSCAIDAEADYTCQNCKRLYNFKVKKKNGATRKLCASCQVNIRKHSNKVKAIEYKGGRCELCGYKKCPRALCFHHRNPSEKDFIISGNHSRKWEVIRKELDKCVLLCHNCHMETHDKIDGVVTSNLSPRPE